jgi:hypothetical protein
MSKINLTDITGGYQSTAVHNTNNQTLEDAIDNTLSRDGQGPNQMEFQLDMNSNRIVNCLNAVHQQEPVTLAQAASIAGVVNPLNREDIGSYLWPQSANELAAGITPTYYYYIWGDVRRYGAIADSASESQGTDNYTAFQNALDSGHTAFVPDGWYSCESTLVMDSVGNWDGTHLVLSPNTRIEKFSNNQVSLRRRERWYTSTTSLRWTYPWSRTVRAGPQHHC